MNNLGSLNVSVNSSVVSQAFDNELLLFNLETDNIYQLNSTGKRLWELVSAGNNVTEVQEQLLREYDIDREQLVLEIQKILAMLVDEKLVTISDAD